MQERWKTHVAHLNLGYHHCTHLQNSWNKYGSGAFIFEMVEWHPSGTLDKVLEEYEQKWMDDSPRHQLLNSRLTAKITAGYRLSSETKTKISQANKGKKRTPEQIEKTRLKNIGRKDTPEQKAVRTQKLIERWATKKRANDVCGHLDLPHSGRGMCLNCRRNYLYRQTHEIAGPPPIDMTGQRFDSILVVSQAENKSGRRMWNCLCDCGKTVVIRGQHLRASSIKSCGCKSHRKVS